MAWWKGATVLLVALVIASTAAHGEGFFSTLMDAAEDAIASISGRDPLNAQGLPKVRVGGRVIDLMSAEVFDDLLKDTPDEMRPPSVVAFYDSSDTQCMEDFAKLDWDHLAEKQLPARERLMVARYDMFAAKRRIWFKFTPEMDLEKRLKVKSCPEVVFVPRKCDGWTEWCEQGPHAEIPDATLIGCEDFKESCTGFTPWDGKSELSTWILNKVDEEGEPQISPFLGSLTEQGKWIRRRDETTVDNGQRNAFLASAFPRFTKYGIKLLKIPPELMKWLDDFIDSQNNRLKKTETWDAESTQVSFHASPTEMISLDHVGHVKEQMGKDYIQPLVEGWSNTPDLELTSFYGVRRYFKDAVLANHVDRADTHWLSATLSVRKEGPKGDNRTWPLEVILFNGERVRFEHRQGEMILYESVSVIHGRPYKNPGPNHLGAFCHFRPTHTEKFANGKGWEETTRASRANQLLNTHKVAYRGRESVEPESPVFTKKEYGAKSRWRRSGQAGSQEVDPESIKAIFKNEADRSLDLYWRSHDGESIHQGTLSPSTSVEINTFRDHHFFWTDRGKVEPLKNSLMIIERGRRTYSFQAN